MIGDVANFVYTIGEILGRTIRIVGLRRRREERDIVTTSTDDIRRGFAMKQEPEDEEDCYMDESSTPPTSTRSPSPPLQPLIPPPLPPTLASSSSPPTSGRSSHHGSVVNRVRSHARSLRAMANPSAVWAHFDLCPNDPLRAQCRICGAIVVRGGANPRQCGTTNLHRHLRVHHGGRLIGRRYHVLQSTSQSSSTSKIRSTQTLVRPLLRNMTSALLPQQQQQQQQPKTLVLKTIPLKVKQVAPTTIKLPSRQTTNQESPHKIVHQQPTEVCLRWNSYHSNMQNTFPSLLDTEQFVDVTLACEGRSLKCHKMILSSCSDYLADLLRENPCQHPIILMKDMKFWEVEALVKFMYRGEVNVAHDKLPQLLNAAEALQVKGLAGPSISSQNNNTKSPAKSSTLLLPQSKPLSSQLVVPKGNSTESKENKTSPIKVSPTTPSSPKRAQKRQHCEPIEPKPFTKIRLQRPVTPSSPCVTVKMEPLDLPLSPTEIFSEDNEDGTASSEFEKLMSLHEEDDPGGEEELDDDDDDDDDDDEDERLHLCELPAPPDLNDNEDQMEFVPTDFLEQQQEIVEEPESSSCKKENGNNKEESLEYTSVDAEDDGVV
ncbi:protein jim lovell-like [Pseudomyrmex gracilis]|uniref:protein jim lovell-like n=1 Tax=Pseudomyrmex gracilis TaxID=219809 RepID=UPI000994D080|nr:protein jim lovell-like [Pseudomyrmex gracilis]